MNVLIYDEAKANQKIYIGRKNSSKYTSQKKFVSFRFYTSAKRNVLRISIKMLCFNLQYCLYDSPHSLKIWKNKDMKNHLNLVLSTSFYDFLIWSFPLKNWGRSYRLYIGICWPSMNALCIIWFDLILSVYHIWNCTLRASRNIA